MQSIEQVVARGGLCTLLFAIGCESVGGLMVENHGHTPSADARVLGYPAGAMIKLDFTGQPVQVTLDGSHSNDPDGHIASYRWQAWTGEKTVTDGGVDAGPVWRRADGAGPGWPDDVAQPTVALGEGTHVFTLWVIDDSGNTSAPDSVRIDVQPSLSPEATAQCIANALEGTDPVCVNCLCGVSDACRNAVSASQCDDACWALIGCIGERCPNAQVTGDMTCVPTNCGAFLAPPTALSGARPLGPCFDQCVEACASTP